MRSSRAMIGRSVAAAIAVALAFASTTVRAAGTGPQVLDPNRVVWRALRFAAHKAGLSAAIEVRLRPAGEPPSDQPSGAPLAAAATLGEPREVWLESTTKLPGRTFLARERVDADRATALEIVDTETGARHHRKTYLLSGSGFTLDLVEPASLGELFQPPDRWTRRIHSSTPYPDALPNAARVTGPAGLLYAISAADLKAPGDSLSIHVLVKTQVERVTVRVEGGQPVQLDYQQDVGGAVTPVHDVCEALALVAHSDPMDPASASVFRIFGLEGDVEMLWDATRRLPLQLSGQVKLLGQVQVRLTSATLR